MAALRPLAAVDATTCAGCLWPLRGSPLPGHGQRTMHVPGAALPWRVRIRCVRKRSLSPSIWSLETFFSSIRELRRRFGHQRNSNRPFPRRQSRHHVRPARHLRVPMLGLPHRYPPTYTTACLAAAFRNPANVAVRVLATLRTPRTAARFTIPGLLLTAWRAVR